MVENLRIKVDDAPPDLLRSDEPQPGDVYAKAGGVRPGFWLVLAVSGNTCYVLAFDREGQITGAQGYGVHYFRDRPDRRVGYIELPTFQVNWELPRDL